MATRSPNFAPGTPLYRQVRDSIVDLIRQSPSTGGRELSDSALAERFGVSRITVRKAVQDLVDAGILYRVQGVGTFARPHKLSERLTLKSFLEPWASDSGRLDVQIRTLERIPADEHLAALLDTRPGDELVFIERLRSHNDTVLAFDQRWLRAADANRISRRDILTQSLVDYLRDREGIAFDHGTMEIEARSAARDEADRLGLRKGDPILVRRVQFFAAGDRPILVGTSIYRADRVTYKVDISG